MAYGWIPPPLISTSTACGRDDFGREVVRRAAGGVGLANHEPKGAVALQSMQKTSKDILIPGQLAWLSPYR